MNAKDIIKVNNQKRDELNDENLADYEDMLLYIRLNSAKSEYDTEEILLELLEHLLQAQDQGKTAKDVFGQNLKEYCQEIIEEIPNETRKKQLRFSMYIILYFLAIYGFITGVIGFGLYYLFNIGSNMTTISIGSGITMIVIYLLILYLFILGILKWLKSSVFTNKKRNKWIGFLQIWGFSVVSIGLFILVIYLMPSFGPMINIPTILFAGIGIVLYLMSRLFKN